MVPFCADVDTSRADAVTGSSGADLALRWASLTTALRSRMTGHAMASASLRLPVPVPFLKTGFPTDRHQMSWRAEDRPPLPAMPFEMIVLKTCCHNAELTIACLTRRVPDNRRNGRHKHIWGSGRGSDR